MRRKPSKYSYVVDSLNDITNVVYTYDNLIELRHYSSIPGYTIAGFEHDGGYTRRALKIIGRLLIKEGFTPLSPKEVAVQVALGVLPQPHIAFSHRGNKLIRAYIRDYGNTRTTR